MGLFDRLFNRKEKVDEPETEESDELNAGFRMWEDAIGFGPAKHDSDEPKSVSKSEKLEDLSQDDRNHLVEFNAYIANVVRYPKSPSERKEVADVLNQPVTNRDELNSALGLLDNYEFGTDSYSNTFHEATDEIADTIFKESKDGQLTSIHELFDIVNQKYVPNEVMYSGDSPYIGDCSDNDDLSRMVLQDTAVFVHDHDTLDDVYKRNEDVYADSEKDYGVSLDQFAKFKDVEDSFQEGLEYSDDEDYAKRYANYYEPTFHTSYDLVDYLQGYKDIHNDSLNKNDEKFLMDKDLKAFADFATVNMSDAKKEYGFSLYDTLHFYDARKLDYLRNSVSNIQFYARNQPDCTLTTRYDFIRATTADRHQDAIAKENYKLEQQENETLVDTSVLKPSVELKVETSKPRPTKTKEKDEGLEP